MIKSASTLFTGTLLGQLLPLAATPILTRFVKPEEFGIFALILTLVAFAGYGSAGRYDAAVAVADSEDMAIALVKVAIVTCAASMSLAAIGIGIALLLVRESPSFGPAWLGLPVLAVCYALLQTWESWANRHDDFAAIARSRTVRGIGVASCQVVLLVCGTPPLAALVLGQIFGMASSLVAGLARQPGLMARLRTPWSLREIRSAARLYANYPRYNMWHGLVHAAQAPLTLAIVGAFTSPAALGAFGLVQRLLQAPSGLVGSAVAPVLLRRLVKSTDALERRRVVLRTLLALSVIAVPSFGIVMLWGGELFVRVFGAQWQLAGEVARVYAPYLMLSFIAAPLTVVSQAARKLLAAMYASMTGNVVFLGILLMSVWSGRDVVGAFAWVSVAMSIYFAIYLIWVVRIAGFRNAND